MGRSQARPGWLTAGAAAVAATLVLLLAGCGSSSSSSSRTTAPASSSPTSQTTPATTPASTPATQSSAQFKAAIGVVLNQFKQASQATGAALQQASSQTDALLATRFQQLTATWAAAVTKLKTLKPPPQFAAAYSRLNSQVSKVPEDLAAIASAAQSHNTAAAKAATTKLVNDIVSAKATSTTISNAAP